MIQKLMEHLRNNNHHESDDSHPRMQGILPEFVETAHSRIFILNLFFIALFGLMVLRVADLTIIKYKPTQFCASLETGEEESEKATLQTKRGEIVDRNGIVLATSLFTASLYADPSEIIDPKESAKQLVSLLPELGLAEIEAKLSVENKRFVWLQRHLTPRQHHDINALGIPGLHFEKTEKRVYLHGPLASHVLGFSDTDSNGIAGVEHSFNDYLRTNSKPLQLSLDIRIQHILREEILQTIDKHKAIGGMGTVMDVQTGEIVAMVSLPDFDPNQANLAKDVERFNANTAGVYELGSGLKLLTAAMALDSGKVTFASGYDASHPITVGRQQIHDYRGQKRYLTLPEIIVHSSNIGAAKMAMDVGAVKQREYLARFGLFKPTRIELPEVSRPLFPSTQNWKDVNTMTIAFGHGMAVSPVQMLSAISTLVNGGILYRPTLVKKQSSEEIFGERVISEKTSLQSCKLMRSVVLEGTGRKAAVPGYLVAGKSGTAEKIKNGRYSKTANLASFIGAFPIHAPRYVVFVMIDEPKGTKETAGYATGGWIGSPLAGRVIKRIAPILGIQPVDENDPSILKRTLVNYTGSKLNGVHLAAVKTR
ncbi:MAG: penicillin-binding protein 2 [Alphaproteobacteria bacterium]|nr:penicillin-binding protein 2 [Alphaproteobacteria bacterium]